MTIGLNGDVLNKIADNISHQFYVRGSKIDAIKAFRIASNLGLKESKDFIDAAYKRKDAQLIALRDEEAEPTVVIELVAGRVRIVRKDTGIRLKIIDLDHCDDGESDAVLCNIGPNQRVNDYASFVR